jgi:hypothetical protein
MEPALRVTIGHPVCGGCAGHAPSTSRRLRNTPPTTAPASPRPAITAALAQSGLVAGAGTMWKNTEVSKSQWLAWTTAPMTCLAGAHGLDRPMPRRAATLSDVARIPEIADVKRRFFEHYFRRAEPVISGAIARGELPAATDPAELVKTLIAPIYLRLLVTAEPIDEATADHAAKVARAAASAGALRSATA